MGTRAASSLIRRRFLLAAAALTAALVAAPAAAQKFETSAPHAILVDAETGTVLFEKAADELMAPASLAKLMTAAVLFEEMRKGRIKPDDEFTVSENAWRRGGAPSRGSSMFLSLGSKVRVADLIPGLIVLSGNDAAIAIAEALGGSEDNFGRMMTARARELGLAKSVFRNASGMGDVDQKTTAREMAALALHIITAYPDQYPVFAQKEFTWNKIRQLNRNPLLTMDIGADGLKTGNIGESGFGLVGSAVRDGQRLVVVLNGASTAKERAAEARKMLDWGFRSFESRLLFKAASVIGQASVYGGATSGVDLVAGRDVRLLIPRGTQERVSARIVYQGPLVPPVEKGARIGRLVVMRGTVTALDLPLYAAEDVPQGGITRRASMPPSSMAANWCSR